MARVLTVDDLLAMHDDVLTLGGLPGLRSYHALCVAAMHPYLTVFGEDAYPSIPEKAAAHAFFIIDGHVFNDGCKRTAALALTTFLDLNDYELIMDDEDALADTLVALANSELTHEAFAEWVTANARAKEEASS